MNCFIFQAIEAVLVESGTPVTHSVETTLTTEKYEIV
jgi:hypothetical protein